ncbi:glycosyltransferase family 39 protein [Mycobacterium sp. MYCO198283]|uniref:glycosyltransferase family 39 protein n=1 Tax=Mycobacterium sp. MYCO198283 TaxID=2883505 RepID=UPI001E47EC89|nr:glycosyltransferase family 39 protein [Mycobacterium sp. MYCO198283]MCG5432417.1 glycosyltransferase family 39 protein [Mycobacterium sp. MYCO198283]
MVPLVVGVLGAAISLVGAGRPSFWYDEAATISASYSRPLPELWQLLDHVDAVHGLYYLLMHGWFTVVPPTEFWSRVPSGLAVGAAAAGVVVLGRQLSSPAVGMAAGMLCAILPRATWAGVEARPFAMSMMLAAWVTVLLIYAARRASWWAWTAYGLLLAVSVLLEVYLVLLALVHVAFVLLFRRERAVLLPFGAVTAVVLAAVAPFVLLVASQVRQLAWITPIGSRTVEDVAVQQYFDRSPWFALLAAAVIAAAAAMGLTSRRPVDRPLVTLSVLWLAVPTALIVARSAVVEPLYTPRYLTFTVPAMALLLGTCVVAVAWRTWVAAALVAVFAAVAAPTHLAVQRAPYAKYGMDYSQVADLISAEAKPGDCLFVNDTVTFHPAPMRPLLAARPDAYRQLADVSRWQRAVDTDGVFDTNLIPEASVGPLQNCAVVWVITQADPQAPRHEAGSAIPPGPLFGGTSAFAVTHDVGLRLVERWQFSLVQVLRAER